MARDHKEKDPKSTVTKAFQTSTSPLAPEESLSMPEPKLDSKALIQATLIFLNAAQKAGVPIHIMTSDEMKAEGKWPPKPRSAPKPKS